MSSASIPAPRSGTATPSRHNYFWPIFIFLAGAGLLAFYEVESLEDQLSQVTSAADKIDPQVRMSQYEKGKFYALARDLLRLAPKHPAADKLVNDTGIRKLAVTQPVLMSLDQPSGFTNAAPVEATKPMDTPTAPPATPSGSVTP